MKTEFKKISAKDGLELHGLHFVPDSKSVKGIIHIHGLSGNFYENQFLVNMAEEYTKLGLHFFVFNNRGHDYVSDNVKIVDGKRAFVKGGGAYEMFSECPQDVMGIYDYMKSCGVTDFCIQGHSMGCNKTVFSLYKFRSYFESLKGVVLLSPCDGIGLMEHSLGDYFPVSIKQAKELIVNGQGTAFVDQDEDLPLMSAMTYADHYKADGDHDIFPYRTPAAEFKELQSIDVPLFVGIGSNDEYIVGSVNYAIDIIRSKVSSKKIGSAVIQEASHDYAGYEKKLVDEVSNWLREISFA